jgi:hypothetical protein
MRLSEAIALGRVLIDKPQHNTFCKCAIGMGLAAIGHEFHIRGEEGIGSAYFAALDEWPWLFGDCEMEISRRFVLVMKGDLTLEELIDFVRSVEPPEPPASPSPAAETEQAVTVRA